MATHQHEKITQDMTIGEIFSRFPHKSQRLAQAMTNAGLHCSSCSAATWETLEAGMLGHGMVESDIAKLLDTLNAILEEEVNLETITLTKRAAKKFREFAKEEGNEAYALRFADTAGGCGGFQYILDFSEKADEEDAIFFSEGIEIHVKKGGMLGRLLGAVIDYVDGLQGAGFKISNPNVKSSCGCGTSQGY
jgi:iron-sulfur cluster assembly protein